MLDNCNYNAVKTLHDLSKLAWFIKNHAEADEKKEKHPECLKMYKSLLKDLEKHIDAFKDVLG